MNAESPLQPFDRIPPHRIVRGFLGEELIGRLLAYAQAKEDAFTETEVGGGRIDPEIRVSRVLRNFGELHDEIEQRFRAIIPQAMADLGLLPFELAKCEMELVAHGDGAFYQRHIDTRIHNPDAKTQRAMTGVLYFHAQPKGYGGGQLRLYAFDPGSEHYVDIESERDLLLLFPAWAPHEVMPVSCPSGKFADSRFAINCWYRRPVPHSAVPPDA
jgi:SM-20-related protein